MAATTADLLAADVDLLAIAVDLLATVVASISGPGELEAVA
jgi:hypothetical protein